MALQDYVVTPWVNGTTPAINSEKLLNIEYGIERATKAIQVNESDIFALKSVTEYNPFESTDTVLGGFKHEVRVEAEDTTLYLWTDTPPPAP